MGLRRGAAQPRLDLGSGMSPPPAQAGWARTWENTHKDLGILSEAGEVWWEKQANLLMGFKLKLVYSYTAPAARHGICRARGTTMGTPPEQSRERRGWVSPKEGPQAGWSCPAEFPTTAELLLQRQRR